MPFKPSPLSAAEKIEHYSMPEPNTGCWLWLGSDAGDKEHRAKVWIDGRSQYAARVSFRAYRGVFASHLKVLHRCDTPACVNPDHLFLGTMLDNAQDRDNKKRRTPLKGEQIGTAIISAEQVKQIREATGTQKEIGARFGIDQTTVSLICSRKLWKHVD